MAQSQVRAFLSTQAAPQKHSIAVMPNGMTAALVMDQQNQNGDNQPRVYIYVSNAARTSWTLSQSWVNQPSGQSRGLRAAMSIDASGNLHVAYSYFDGTNEGLKYRKLTYSAGAYSLGAEETVLAQANRVVAGLDIDSVCDSTTMPVIATVLRTGSGTYTSTTICYNRNSATAWPAQTLRTSTTDGSTVLPDICITARDPAASGGLFQAVVSLSPGPGGVDNGDSIYCVRANVGGAWTGTATVLSGIAKNYNLGYRNYDVYWLASDTFMVYGTIQSAPHKAWYTVFTTSPSSATITTQIAGRVIDIPQARYYRYGYKIMSSTQIRDSGSSTSGTICAFNLTGGGPWLTTHEWSVTGGVWKVTETRTYGQYDRGSSVPSTALQVWAGDRGRFFTNQLDVMVPFTRLNAYTVTQKVYNYSRTAIPTCSIVTPSNNSIVATSKPDIVVSVQGAGVDAGNIRSRIQVQVSPSASFDTGVTTITQDRSLEAYYNATAASVKVSLKNYPISQGIYYIRARAINQFQYGGAWSASSKITVSHPPRAQNLAPQDGSVLIYSAAGSGFNWKFADAYADDIQTAARLRGVDQNGNTVFDTGKTAVDPTTSSMIVSISSAYIESYVDWYITLWDGDDVAGPELTGGTVLLTQIPTPTITAPPSDGTIVSTAIPVYTWTNGIAGGKTQATYRLQLREANGGVLIFDTRTRVGTETSYTQQTGKLKNGRSYELSLIVTDSVGLTATTVRRFSVAWTLPNVASQPLAYDEYMDRLGFVAVKCSVANMDSDILYWNLYRRSLELGAAWVLVEQRASSSDWVFRDYLCPAGVTSEYVLSQVVNRFGDVIESQIDTASRGQVKPNNQAYWLIDRDFPDKSVRLATSISDSLTHEYEEESYTVVGKGRQVEVGEDVGMSGSITTQVRDKDIGHGFMENYNLLANPGFYETDGLGGTPPGWLLTDTNNGFVSQSWDEAVPGPAGKKTRSTTVVQKKVADTNTVSTGYWQEVVAANEPYWNPVAGQQMYYSAWFTIPQIQPGYRFVLLVQWYQDTTVLSTQQADYVIDTGQMNGANAGTILEQKIFGDTIWTRIGRVLTVPAGTNKMRVFGRIMTVSGASTILNPISICMEGFSITLGSYPVQYFDGDQLGMTWAGVPRVDPAYTPGALLARSVRQRIESIKGSKDALTLRTPFGDLWPVHVGNIQIDRVAGVSNNEFVDMVIPYLEVRDTGTDIDDDDPHSLPSVRQAAFDAPYYNNAVVASASGSGSGVSYDEDGTAYISSSSGGFSYDEDGTPYLP